MTVVYGVILMFFDIRMELIVPGFAYSMMALWLVVTLMRCLLPGLILCMIMAYQDILCLTPYWTIAHGNGSIFEILQQENIAIVPSGLLVWLSFFHTIGTTVHLSCETGFFHLDMIFSSSN